MNSAIERLMTPRVADAMSKAVVSVSHRDSMAQASRTFLEHSISGAPVVDEQQFCVGILSAVDFVKKQGCVCGNVEKADCQGDLVCHHMTPSVQSISSDKPLLAAARMMCAEHIHRLPVLDFRGRPLGMITALDVVAAVVNAVQE